MKILNSSAMKIKEAFESQMPILLRTSLIMNAKKDYIDTFLKKRFRRPLRKNDVRVSQNGIPHFDLGMIANNGVFDATQLAQLFSKQATLIFENLERTDLQCKSLANEIGKKLNEKTHLNAYLSPPNAKGFGCHWDVHDVLVVQVYGTKKWKLWRNPIPSPLPFETFDNLSQLDQDKLRQSDFEEITLNAGDLLYLPRGYLHAVETEASASLHFTVGIDVVTDYSAFEKSKGMKNQRKWTLLILSYLFIFFDMPRRTSARIQFW